MGTFLHVSPHHFPVFIVKEKEREEKRKREREKERKEKKKLNEMQSEPFAPSCISSCGRLP